MKMRKMVVVDTDRPADTVTFAFHAAKIRMRRLRLARRAKKTNRATRKGFSMTKIVKIRRL